MVLGFIPRKPKRTIAIFFIFIGTLLALPPFVNVFLVDDLINIWIAKFITERTGISMLNSLILTYTLIAWSIILGGFYLFPYNTGRLINGFFHKIQNGIRLYINKVKNEPLYLLGAFLAIVIFYKIYLFYASKVILP